VLSETGRPIAAKYEAASQQIALWRRTRSTPSPRSHLTIQATPPQRERRSGCQGTVFANGMLCGVPAGNTAWAVSARVMVAAEDC
jgi:hypothetical protein